MVIGFCAAVFGAAVGFAETADADGFAHVDVSGYGGGADVEPAERDC